MPAEPRWLAFDDVLTIHRDQLAMTGGAAGVRDEHLIHSAMARPLHSFAYGQEDVVTLAVELGVGIARNHPFIDGNKRTGLAAAAAFLALNGFGVEAPDAPDDIPLAKGLEAVLTRELDEDGFAELLGGYVVPLDD